MVGRRTDGCLSRTAQQVQVGVIFLPNLDGGAVACGRAAGCTYLGREWYTAKQSKAEARRDGERQGSRATDWVYGEACDYVLAWRVGRVAWLPAVPCVSTRCACR
jgi:hypothetical protein